MTDDLDPDLVAYLTARARARAALVTLRPYERRILREAAVMGYVLGYQSGNIDGRQGHGGALDREQRIPHDSDIVRTVVEHCDSTADLYPYIAAACSGFRRRITRKRMWPGEAQTADESKAESRPHAEESKEQTS